MHADMGSRFNAYLHRTTGATVVPFCVNVTDETALVSIIDHVDTVRKSEDFDSDQSPGTMVLVELATGHWECLPELDKPAVRDAMDETIRLLRQSLSVASSDIA